MKFGFPIIWVVGGLALAAYGQGAGWKENYVNWARKNISAKTLKEQDLSTQVIEKGEWAKAAAVQNLNSENFLLELSGLYDSVLAEQDPQVVSARFGIMGAHFSRVIGNLMSDDIARKRFGVSLVNPEVNKTFKSAAFDAYAKALFRKNERAQLESAEYLWTSALEDPQVDPDLKARILRRMGQNASLRSSRIFFENIGADKSETVKLGARWGLFNYLKRVHEKLEKQDILQKIKASTRDDAKLDPGMVKCLAILEIEEANGYLLSKNGRDIPSLVSALMIQKSDDDKVAIAASEVVEDSSDQAMDVSTALRRRYEFTHGTTVKKLISGSPAQVAFGLKLALLFPESAVMNATSVLSLRNSPDQRIARLAAEVDNGYLHPSTPPPMPEAVAGQQKSIRNNNK